MSPIKTVGQAIVEALVAEGVDTTFGIPGTHNIGLYDPFNDFPNVRHISARHENNAAYMAEMYGRLTGRPAVCLVTAGPGAIHSMAGVAQAFNMGSPMIHIGGAVSWSEPKESLHAVDNPGFVNEMFKDITKWSVRIENPEETPQIMAKAFSIMRSGRPGPVHISVPWVLTNARMGAKPSEIPPYQKIPPMEKPTLDATILDKMADLIKSARQPMIYAGRGVLIYRADKELGELAEGINAPVISPMDFPLPYDHPFWVGGLGFGGEADNFVKSLQEKSDLVIGIGLRAGTRGAIAFNNAPAQKRIFIGYDDNPTAVEKADAAIVADTKQALQEILGRLSGAPRSRGEELRGQIARYKKAVREGYAEFYGQYRDAGPVHFGYAMTQLAQVVDKDAMIVGGGTIARALATHAIPSYTVETHQGSGPWGTMGFPTPGVVGAKLVYPDRVVIGVEGDGGFLMGFNDFGTAVESGAHVMMVIANDAQYTQITRMQEMQFGRAVSNEIQRFNFARFAETFGAVGIRVENSAELKGAFKEAIETTKRSSVIVDVVSDHRLAMTTPSVNDLIKKLN